MNSRMGLPKLLLNVPALADQPREVVERILGRPEGTTGAMVSQHEKVAYRGGKVEVLYTDGRAKRITLFNPHGMLFSQQSLSKLGLPPKKPTYSNRKQVMSWSKICNLQEVTLYADSKGGVSSVMVRALSPSNVPQGMNRRPSLTRSGRTFWTTPISLSTLGVSSG